MNLSITNSSLTPLTLHWRDIYWPSSRKDDAIAIWGLSKKVAFRLRLIPCPGYANRLEEAVEYLALA